MPTGKRFVDVADQGSDTFEFLEHEHCHRIEPVGPVQRHLGHSVRGGVEKQCLITLFEINHRKFLLIRRIRGRLPHAPIVVGFWPEDARVLEDQSHQTAIGADHYVTSLHDAVTACLEIARKGGEVAANDFGNAVRRT